MVMFKKLREVREDHDLTQIDISKLLSITKQNYSRWETNEKTIPLKHLKKLCDFYKMSFDYLCGLCKENNYVKINLDKKIIGNRIKQIRYMKNLTQKDLANLLNTTQSTVSVYENGVNLILTSFAYQICVKYNISMDWLCGRK